MAFLWVSPGSHTFFSLQANWAQEASVSRASCPTPGDPLILLHVSEFCRG